MGVLWIGSSEEACGVVKLLMVVHIYKSSYYMESFPWTGFKYNVMLSDIAVCTSAIFIMYTHTSLFTVKSKIKSLYRVLRALPFASHWQVWNAHSHCLPYSLSKLIKFCSKRIAMALVSHLRDTSLVVFITSLSCCNVDSPQIYAKIYTLTAVRCHLLIYGCNITIHFQVWITGDKLIA